MIKINSLMLYVRVDFEYFFCGMSYIFFDDIFGNFMCEIKKFVFFLIFLD